MSTHWKHAAEKAQSDEKLRIAKAKAKHFEEQCQSLTDHLRIERARGKFKSSLSDSEPRAIKVRPQKNSQSVAFAVASDWHAEELVDPATVNDINEFNSAIATSRIDAFSRAIIKLTNTQRVATDIDTLVLPFLGDFMSGHIHDDLIESTSTSPTLAAQRVKRHLLGVIKYLREHGHFKRIIVPCHYGNHSRNTRKPRCSTSYLHNYEYVVYEDIADTVKELGWTDVEIRVNKGYHSYLNVYDSVIRFHHGDNIRFAGGVGGITIPVLKAIAQWDKLRRADLDVFGHYHQFTALRKFICNGSLIGYNAFALSIKADFEPASQAYFLWEARRGRTITTPITLQ